VLAQRLMRDEGGAQGGGAG